MAILWGIIYMMFGAFFVWLGTFMLFTAMLPESTRIDVAALHGAWVREHILRLPPSTPTSTPSTPTPEE